MGTDKDRIKVMGGTTQRVPQNNGGNPWNKIIIIVLLALILLLGSFLVNRFWINPPRASNDSPIILQDDKEDKPTGEKGRKDSEEKDSGSSDKASETEEGGSQQSNSSSVTGKTTEGSATRPPVNAYAGVSMKLPPSGKKLETGIQMPIQNSKSLPDITYDFGDGTSSSGASVSHAYEQPGRYTITAKSPAGKVLDEKVVVIHCSPGLVEKALLKLSSAISRNSESLMLSAESNIKNLFEGGDGVVEMYSTGSNTRSDDFRLEQFFDRFYSVENPYSSVRNVKTDNSNGKIKLLQLYK